MKSRVLLLFFSLAAISLEASSVYTFSDAMVTKDRNLSLGFVFSTNSAITISSLGYFDANGVGLGSSHTVGIFDSTGQLLVSTTLCAGDADPLVDGFRFESIAPVTLAAGQTYTLAGTSGTADSWAYGDAGSTFQNLQVDSRITIAPDGARFLYQDDELLRDPTDHYRYTAYAGPSFEIAATAVPEPGSGWLAAAALLMTILICASRRLATRSADLESVRR